MMCDTDLLTSLTNKKTSIVPSVRMALFVEHSFHTFSNHSYGGR